MAAQSVNGTNVGKHHGRGDSRRAAIGCCWRDDRVIAGCAAYSARRSLVQGPDGNLYVVTDGGEIWRVVPS